MLAVYLIMGWIWSKLTFILSKTTKMYKFLCGGGRFIFDAYQPQCMPVGIVQRLGLTAGLICLWKNDRPQYVNFA